MNKNIQQETEKDISESIKQTAGSISDSKSYKENCSILFKENKKEFVETIEYLKNLTIYFMDEYTKYIMKQIKSRDNFYHFYDELYKNIKNIGDSFVNDTFVKIIKLTNNIKLNIDINESINKIKKIGLTNNILGFIQYTRKNIDQILYDNIKSATRLLLKEKNLDKKIMLCHQIYFSRKLLEFSNTNIYFLESTELIREYLKEIQSGKKINENINKIANIETRAIDVNKLYTFEIEGLKDKVNKDSLVYDKIEEVIENIEEKAINGGAYLTTLYKTVRDTVFLNKKNHK